MRKYLAAGIIILASNTVFAEEWRGKGTGSCGGSDWPFTFTASVSNGKLDGMLKTSSFDFPLKGDVKDGLADVYSVGAMTAMLVMVDMNENTVRFSADAEDCSGVMKIVSDGSGKPKFGSTPRKGAGPTDPVASKASSSFSLEEKLEKVKSLLNRGLITAGEAREKRTEILKEF
jgi:hypothetical protein